MCWKWRCTKRKKPCKQHRRGVLDVDSSIKSRFRDHDRAHGICAWAIDRMSGRAWCAPNEASNAVAWVALHLSLRGIALFVPPVHASLCFLVLQHCNDIIQVAKSCSTDWKSMTHDLISFIEHICLVFVMNSLVSTFGDGRPVRLCL